MVSSTPALKPKRGLSPTGRLLVSARLSWLMIILLITETHARVPWPTRRSRSIRRGFVIISTPSCGARPDWSVIIMGAGYLFDLTVMLVEPGIDITKEVGDEGEKYNSGLDRMVGSEEDPDRYEVEGVDDSGVESRGPGRRSDSEYEPEGDDTMSTVSST